MLLTAMFPTKTNVPPTRRATTELRCACIPLRQPTTATSCEHAADGEEPHRGECAAQLQPFASGLSMHSLLILIPQENLRSRRSTAARAVATHAVASAWT